MSSCFSDIVRDIDKSARHRDRALEKKEQEQENSEEVKNRNFHQIHSDYGLRAIDEIAKHGGPTAVRVLMLLCRLSNHRNAILITQSDIQRTLSVSRTSVFNAVKFLIEFGIVDRQQTSGGFMFILNPDFTWRARHSERKLCLYNGKALSTKLGKHRDKAKLKYVTCAVHA